MEILGLDIGGSGIKGGIVDTATGQLISERKELVTPQPATPNSISCSVKKMVTSYNWTGPVGCCFPTVVIDGCCKTAGNISPEWIGVQIDDLFSNYCNGLRFSVANDADLAGIAEMSLGAGKGLNGKVILITIGTGLGSAVFQDGLLVPNFELGRMLYTNGKPIEFFAAGSAKKNENLDLEEWTARFDVFLHHVVRISSPDHLIIGGGLSEKFNTFKNWISILEPVTVSKFQNDAGIIGAAIFSHQSQSGKL
ncbi:MAG: polyphosphate glucokinase [Parvicellaceae bacterium]|jgi:polyphosphate glucokinase